MMAPGRQFRAPSAAHKLRMKATPFFTDSCFVCTVEILDISTQIHAMMIEVSVS